MEPIQPNILAPVLPLPPAILALMERFEAAEEEIYLVGGSLRDLLLGKTPHDYDLATSAPPQKTAALFSDCRVIETGLKHGTVTVLWEGEPVEITTFRIDGDYTDARHPDGVTFTRRITEDLARRDFTVNAMAYHPAQGLVDPFGGQADLERRVIRAVRDPMLRFSEDALRMMRAFRFSAQLGFSIEENTLRGCFESKSKLTFVAKERIAAEFLRLLSFPTAPRVLSVMLRGGILSYVVEDYTPNETVLALLADAPEDQGARLALFLSETDREGAALRLRQLKLSNKQITAACAILSCMRTPVASPADARRLAAACGVYAPAAVRLSILLGFSPPEACGWVEENQAPTHISQLAITGEDLRGFGMSGKEIGDTLQALLDVVLEDPRRNQKEALLLLAKERSIKGFS